MIRNDVTEISEQSGLDESECPVFEINSCYVHFYGNPFSGSKIQHILIPKSVKEIPMECFARTTLVTITFEKGSQLEVMDYGAFSESKLTSIVIPASVREISKCCFLECLNLRTVIFDEPSSLTTIEYRTFASCRSLESICLPDSIKEIESRAFVDCSSLFCVKFGENSCLEKINSGAFMGSGLRTFFLPKSVKFIASNAFYSTQKLESFSIDILNESFFIHNGVLMSSDSCMISFLPYLQCCRIPNTVTSIAKNCLQPITTSVYFEEGSSLLELSPWSFASSSLKGIVIPASVTIIRDACFRECISLVSVKFEAPCNVREFCDCAFQKCGFSQFLIPSSVQSIGCKCFADCRNLRDLRFAEEPHLEVIGNHAFTGTAITDIILPDSVRILSRGAFQASKIVNITFGKESKLEELGQMSLASCTLRNVALPKSLCKFSGDVFAQLRKTSDLRVSIDLGNPRYRCLDKVTVESADGTEIISYVGVDNPTISPDIVHIGESCFRYSVMTQCSFQEPTSLKSIGNFAFADCSISAIVIPKTVQVIADSVFTGSMLCSVTFEIPCCLTHIGNKAFSGCLLTQITIPCSVEEIGVSCFAECSMLSVIEFEEPSSTRVIGDKAFEGTDIEEIRIPTSVPELSESYLDNCHRLRIVHHGKDSYAVNNDYIY